MQASRGRSTRPRNHRRLRMTGAALLLALGACTVVQPLPDSPSDLVLGRPQSERLAATPCPAEDKAGTGVDPTDCRHFDVQLKAFHGQLGYAIWSTDLRRRELARMGMERTNTTTAFNAMLWPLGGAVALHAVGHPHTTLLRNAAVFSASALGFMHSGIEGRDQLYLQASRKLSCAITLASADLYHAQEIDALPIDRAGQQQPRRPLAAVHDGLWDARKAYARGRTDLVSTLRLGRTDAPPASTTPLEARRSEVRGTRSGTGAGRPAIVADFQRQTRTELEQSLSLFERLDDLRQRLDGAAGTLDRRRLRVNEELRRALNERTPALATPGDIFAAVQAALVKAQPPSATSQSTAVGFEPTAAQLAALDKDSRTQLLAFLHKHQRPLQQAMDDAQAWLRHAQQRQRVVQDDALTQGCSPSLFGEPLQVAVAATPPASAASAAEKR